MRLFREFQVATVCVESLVSIQSILRPRGPTLNFALEAKQLRLIQQETPLLNAASFNKPTDSSSTALLTQPIPADVPVEQPTLPSQPVRLRSPSPRIIEIRQPESSPKPPLKRLSESNGIHDDDFSTPPFGVTVMADETPTKSTRMMTRKEALKVIAVSLTQQQTIEPPPAPLEPSPKKEKKPSPARKRPHQDPEPLVAPQEKVFSD